MFDLRRLNPTDITVFGDPMPYLHMHKYPGEIECVPDLYRYTIYIQLHICIYNYIYNYTLYILYIDTYIYLYIYT
jgi:hypothetical protein